MFTEESERIADVSEILAWPCIRDLRVSTPGGERRVPCDCVYLVTCVIDAQNHAPRPYLRRHCERRVQDCIPAKLSYFSRVRGVKERRALIRSIQAGCGPHTVEMRRVRSAQMPLPTRRERQLITHLEPGRNDGQ